MPVSAQDQTDAPTVRVRLLELHGPRAITVHSPDGMLAVLGRPDGQPLAQLEPGDLVEIGLRNGELSVSTPVGQLYALTLTLVPEAAFTLALTDGNAPPETRQYAGYLTITPTADGTELLLINHVPLEDYVASVVGREYGFDDVEGAKAMAVLTRTYALRTTGKFGEAYDLVDHSASQVYEGLGRQTDAARTATRATEGEVLTYNGTLIEAVYSASSGGHTADNDAVWDANPLPYLRGKPDPYDHDSPYASWNSTVDRNRLLQLLSANYGFNCDGFLLGDRSRDGRVTTIELLRNGDTYRILPANEFRLLVNRHFGKETLRSTLFTAKRRGDTYLLEGSGFGHGVGLSQYGALALSKQGRSYPEILSFYFTGTRLASMTDMEPVLPAEVMPVEDVIRTAAQMDPPPQERAATPAPNPENEDKSKPKRRVGW